MSQEDQLGQDDGMFSGRHQGHQFTHSASQGFRQHLVANLSGSPGAFRLQDGHTAICVVLQLESEHKLCIVNRKPLCSVFPKTQRKPA